MKRPPLVVFALCACATHARAEGKYNAALVPGIGYHRDSLGFDGSIVAAALFGESQSSAMTLGPRVEVGTFKFETFRLGLGPALHVPIEPLALGLAVHLLGGAERGDVHVGLGGRAVFGFRPYNHYGSYAATGGLSVGVDQWFGIGPSFMLGAQLDAMWLSLPFLAIGELFRG